MNLSAKSETRKAMGIGLMLCGTALFASSTALGQSGVQYASAPQPPQLVGHQGLQQTALYDDGTGAPPAPAAELVGEQPMPQGNGVAVHGNGSCPTGGCQSCNNGGCQSCSTGGCQSCGNGCGNGCGCGCSDSWCDLGDPWDLSDHLFGDCCDIDIGGWTQIGYHSDANGLFNDHPHRVNLHQQWLYVEKEADGSNGLDYGFRFDAMYGVDAADTQAFGNDPGTWDFMNGFDHGIYGWAFPQLYGEIASGDWSVIAGHFYTIVGYEVVTAPDNFFYSHAYTMYNSEPFTHTGILATYSGMEDTEIYAGYTVGWDTGFNQNDSGNNFLGGFSRELTEYATATYVLTLGDFGWRGEGYSHSIVLDVTVTEKMNYVFQSDLVETNLSGDHQFSVNQYLFYTINDCLKLGGRAEWWKDSDISQYEMTFGVNYKPTANLVFRPEVRHDWSPAQEQDFTTFGIDAILTY